MKKFRKNLKRILILILTVSIIFNSGKSEVKASSLALPIGEELLLTLLAAMGLTQIGKQYTTDGSSALNLDDEIEDVKDKLRLVPQIQEFMNDNHDKKPGDNLLISYALLTTATLALADTVSDFVKPKTLYQEYGLNAYSSLSTVQFNKQFNVSAYSNMSSYVLNGATTYMGITATQLYEKYNALTFKDSFGYSRTIFIPKGHIFIRELAGYTQNTQSCVCITPLELVSMYKIFKAEGKTAVQTYLDSVCEDIYTSNGGGTTTKWNPPFTEYSGISSNLPYYPIGLTLFDTSLQSSSNWSTLYTNDLSNNYYSSGAFIFSYLSEGTANLLYNDVYAPLVEPTLVDINSGVDINGNVSIPLTQSLIDSLETADSTTDVLKVVYDTGALDNYVNEITEYLDLNQKADHSFFGGLFDKLWVYLQNIVDSILKIPNGIVEILNTIDLNLGELSVGLIDILTQIKMGIISIPGSVVGAIENIGLKIDALPAAFSDSAGGDEDDPDTVDDTSPGKNGFLQLINMFVLIIAILIILIKIFLQLLIFIVNIFNIPADPGYLNSDMILGLDYLKSINLPLMNIGLNQLIQGALTISMMFGIIKIFRINIDHFKMPRGG